MRALNDVVLVSLMVPESGTSLAAVQAGLVVLAHPGHHPTHVGKECRSHRGRARAASARRGPSSVVTNDRPTLTGRGRLYDRVVLVRATIQQIPPDNARTYDLEARDVVVEDVASYEEGKERIAPQVPEGWRVIGYSTW